MRELVEYARSLDSELGTSVPLRIHADEKAAVAYALEAAGRERTWAVLAFSELSPQARDRCVTVRVTGVLSAGHRWVKFERQAPLHTVTHRYIVMSCVQDITVG